MVKRNEIRKMVVMTAIAVLGGGSLGLLLAGKLTASGCECVLWTRSQIQASLINTNGLSLEEQSGEKNKVNVKAVPMAEISTFQGPVLLAVKQTALTPDFLETLATVVPINGTLVLFQNGIGHIALLQQALPGRKLIAAVTTEGAQRIDETTVRHTGRGETHLGEWHLDDRLMLRTPIYLDNEDTSDTLLLESMLKQAGFSVFLSKQLGDDVLRKLLINAVINPLTAILRVRNGELTQSPARLKLMEALFHETYGILSFYGLRDELELWNTVLQVCKATERNESSMLQDVSLHKETEIEFINGAIYRLAIQQGREAPWNEAVTALVKATR
jgi:2-dehydropantoate 2-reductase